MLKNRDARKINHKETQPFSSTRLMTIETQKTNLFFEIEQKHGICLLLV